MMRWRKKAGITQNKTVHLVYSSFFAGVSQACAPVGPLVWRFAGPFVFKVDNLLQWSSLQPALHPIPSRRVYEGKLTL